MTVNEQIKVLCVRKGLTVAKLSRLLGMSPQSMAGKMKRNSLTIENLEEIAKVTGTTFERHFVLDSGEKV